MNQNLSPQEYIDLISDPLPYTTNWEFILKEVTGKCTNCNQPLTYLKQTITEYSNFIVIRATGICQPCHLVVTLHPLKITNQNQYFVLQNKQWLETKETLINKILNWLKY